MRDTCSTIFQLSPNYDTAKLAIYFHIYYV